MDLSGLPFAVEPMRLADVSTVVAIERQVFTTPWSPQAFRQELVHHSTATYLILRYTDRESLPQERNRRPWARKQDHTLLGYGGVWMVLDQGHISTLAVRPNWRGLGLGELLLASLIEQAMQRGAHHMTLEVRVSNQAAQQLYRKYGFELVGRRKSYYPDNREDALIMSVSSVADQEYQERFVCLRTALRRRASEAADLIRERLSAERATCG